MNCPMCEVYPGFFLPFSRHLPNYLLRQWDGIVLRGAALLET